jgi:hypothetical protein
VVLNSPLLVLNPPRLFLYPPWLVLNPPLLVLNPPLLVLNPPLLVLNPPLQVAISSQHPLVVHIPSGVGGASAGVCWGLTQLLGDNVRVVLAEPTKSPCMLLGLCTGLGSNVSVQDIGLWEETAADALAVSRPGRVACDFLRELVQVTDCVGPPKK